MLTKPTPQPDVDQAVEFLTAFRSNGPLNLCAIVPDSGAVQSATFTNPEEARPWLEKHAGRANLYYTINPAPQPTGSGGRVNKQDIPLIENLHVDVDTDKQDNDLSLDKRKAVARERLERSRHPPTFIIDSGGGLQAIWRLAEPAPSTPDNIEQAEAANRWLVEQFGGDPNTTDISRLLRLPGTVNHPDQRKRARGRVTAPTRLLVATGELHGREAFGQVERAPHASVSDKEAIECLPLIEDVTDIDALVAEYGLDERTRTIILEGRVPGQVKESDDSRDKWMFEGACRMVRAGVPVGVIAGVLLNSEWEISGHILDHTGRPTEVYAMRQALRARATVEAERAKDIEQLTSTPVDAEWLANAPDAAEWPSWFRDNWVAIGQRDIAAIPPTPWLTPGLLLYGDVTTIGGRGGSGKSLLGWQIVVSVATGTKLAWWPAPERPRKVLVISGEDDANEIERRVSAACQAMGVKRSDLGDNFLVWSDRNIRLALKDAKTGTVTRTKLWHGIRWAVENLGVGLIVMDPLVKVSSGFDESSNDDMDQLYGIIRELTVGHSCAALNIDHFAKGGTGGDQASIRGASAKVDAARVALTLTGMTEAEYDKLRPSRPREAFALCVDAKQNYSAKSGGHWLEFIDYEVGNGEMRPSLVWLNLEADNEFLDPQRWPRRMEFLRLVADGREGGQPWSVTNTGPRKARLAVAVSEAFGLTERKAEAWIAAFASEGSITVVDWKRPNRTVASVWALNRDYQTEEDADSEALRA